MVSSVQSKPQPKPSTMQEVLQRYPRLTAHMISDSLGYLRLRPWPRPSSTTSFAPGICRAMNRKEPTGVCTSRSPTSTNVGAFVWGSSAVVLCLAQVQFCRR